MVWLCSTCETVSRTAPPQDKDKAEREIKICIKREREGWRTKERERGGDR